MIDGKIRQYHQLPRDYFKDWQLIYISRERATLLKIRQQFIEIP